MSLVAFNPTVQSFAFCKIITFSPIAATTGQNKIMRQIVRIQGPWNEMIEFFLPTEDRLLAVEAFSILQLTQNRSNAGPLITLTAEEEFSQIKRSPYGCLVEPPHHVQPLTTAQANHYAVEPPETVLDSLLEDNATIHDLIGIKGL